MNEPLSDERIIVLINEFAKFDPEAFLLMAKLQEAKEYGEKDSLICKMAHYLKSNGKS